MNSFIARGVFRVLSVNKFDLITWVKDGAWVLPTTLKRLEDVLPTELVHRKIMVDDGSKDETRNIGKDFNWEVYSNPGSGISSGANYALSKVDCPFFMSFEQDLFLSKDWCAKILGLMENDKVAVASGMRFSNCPKAVHDLEKYVHMKYLLEEKIAPYLANRRASAYTLGKTLDNTLFRTSAVQKIGGFPVIKTGFGIDTLLSYTFYQHGYVWIVDPTCHSIHLRHGLSQELKHQRWYAVAAIETRERLKKMELDLPWNVLEIGVKYSGIQLLMSPFVGVFVSIKTRNPMISVVHPLLKLFKFVGHLDSLKGANF